jgi:NADH:ubiquinone oxidoreductase subunit D
VFRAILTLEGETVVAVDAVIGYLHRCHEKLSETLTYAQYPSIASKTDYVAAMTSEFAYVMAAEQIGKIDVPKRAQYLRVIAAELQRIASHLLWLGTWCMDMGGALGGGATIFLYAIRERETILDLFESLVGARLLYGFYQVGGTRYDIPPGWADACRKTIADIDQRIGEYEGLLEDNPFFLARAQGVGHISRELAEDVGIAGPLLRGSGVNFDIRRSAPYSSYEDFTFTVPVETAGDCSRATACEWWSSASRSKSSGRRSTRCPMVRSRRGQDSSRSRRSGFPRARPMLGSKGPAARSGVI